MNENYLWDKSETDAEIEQLEAALQQFRYQKTAPPALPAKIVLFETKNSRRFFNWSIAFAAFATLLIISFGAWLQFANRSINTAKSAPELIAPPTLENSVKEMPIEKQATSKIEKIETPKQFNEPQLIKARKIVSQVVRQNKITKQINESAKPQVLTARLIETKKLAVKLTKEEVYAYDQLMLALSITNSKLKLVSDKIDAVDKQTADPETER